MGFIFARPTRRRITTRARWDAFHLFTVTAADTFATTGSGSSIFSLSIPETKTLWGAIVDTMWVGGGAPTSSAGIMIGLLVRKEKEMPVTASPPAMDTSDGLRSYDWLSFFPYDFGARQNRINKVRVRQRLEAGDSIAVRAIRYGTLPTGTNLAISLRLYFRQRA
jgi:hypothetical protein